MSDPFVYIVIVDTLIGGKWHRMVTSDRDRAVALALAKSGGGRVWAVRARPEWDEPTQEPEQEAGMALVPDGEEDDAAARDAVAGSRGRGPRRASGDARAGSQVPRAGSPHGGPALVPGADAGQRDATGRVRSDAR